MHLPTVPRLKDPVLYQGRQVGNEAKVLVSRAGHIAQLRLRHDLYNRSIGHEWGYSGAGPAQLAFDLLMDMFEDEAFARRYHTAFDGVLGLRTPHGGEWELAGGQILEMIEAINKEKGWGPLDPSSEEFRRLSGE